jgi:hypothetical protein
MMSFDPDTMEMITHPTGLTRTPLKFPMSEARPRLQPVASQTQKPAQHLR